MQAHGLVDAIDFIMHGRKMKKDHGCDVILTECMRGYRNKPINQQVDYMNAFLSDTRDELEAMLEIQRPEPDTAFHPNTMHMRWFKIFLSMFQGHGRGAVINGQQVDATVLFLGTFHFDFFNFSSSLTQSSNLAD